MGETTVPAKKKRRIFPIVLLVLVLGLVGLHTLWTAISGSHLRQRISALQTAGEPIMPADFLPKEGVYDGRLHDEILAAAKLLKQETDVWQRFERLDERLPLRPDEKQTITTVVGESSAALDRLEKAQLLPISPWNVSPTWTAMFVGSNEISATRELRHVVASSALLEHEQGNDRRAMKRLEQLLLLSDWMNKSPSVVGHLYAVSLQGSSADTAIQMMSDLKIGTNEQDATPQQVAALIHAFLDEQRNLDGLRLGIKGERALQQDMMRSISDGTPVTMAPGQPVRPYLPRGRYVLKPLLNRSAVLMFDYMTQLIPLADEKSLPVVREKLPHLPGKSLLNTFAHMLLPSMARMYEAHFRGVVNSRMAATALAIRWYAVDHDGKLPDQLEQLVPKYLPAVPADPFSKETRPIGYLPQAKSPILYSVSDNGIDDGGSSAATNPKISNPNEWQMQDYIVHLTRQPRPVPDVDDDESASPADVSTALEQVKIPATTPQ